MPESALIPVTVIGGYLGAGKTTVINSLLSEPHGRRLAVLVNDFGALDIDARLIAARAANTVSLTNGCVCCSITDALGDGLDEVLALEPPPHQIVIETSGVADPGKIAVYGQGWPGVRLGTVATVLDATSMAALAADRFVGSLIVRQLAAADLILLSKTDLLDDQALTTAHRWLAANIGSTPVMAIEHGKLPPLVLLDVAISNTRRSNGGVRSGRRAGEPIGGVGFGSQTIGLDGPIDRAALEAALDEWPDAVVRVKGFVRTTEPGRPVREVQRVGRRWTIQPSDQLDAPSALVLVVVGGLPSRPFRLQP